MSRFSWVGLLCGPARLPILSLLQEGPSYRQGFGEKFGRVRADPGGTDEEAPDFVRRRVVWKRTGAIGAPRFAPFLSLGTGRTNGSSNGLSACQDLHGSAQIAARSEGVDQSVHRSRFFEESRELAAFGMVSSAVLDGRANSWRPK